MSTLSIRLPDDIAEMAVAQAAAQGLSLDEYVALTLALRLGAQMEAEKYLAARGTRGAAARALDALSRMGVGNPPLPGDELEPRPPSVAG